ncbi:MAG: ComEC/Rec2 family competence protein [Caldilineaceae bacterium]|nr:ComEC/Rec2 family competence protein [Caldilineaceae bacterium]
MTLLYLFLAYVLGVLLGQILWEANGFGCHFPPWLWLIPLTALPLVPLFTPLTRRQRHPQDYRWPLRAGFAAPTVGPSPRVWLACLLCLGMGSLRYGGQPLTPCWTPTDLAFYNLPADRAFDRAAPTVMITGYVSSYPLIADTQQAIHVVARQLTANGVPYPVHGELRLTTGIRQSYGYGQPIQLQGRLVTPPDFADFSYREYLARHQIHSLFYDATLTPLAGPRQGHWLTRGLYTLRARGEALINRLLPEPYAALTNGMVLGIEAGIPDALYEQFNRTGVSHTIVISGSNISILAALLFGLGQRLWGRRRALWPTLLGIGGYALMVGGDAAVVRAALMGGLFVTATAIGRRSTAIISLAAACWVMTMLNPLVLWDAGFQLSGAATLGLILFTPGLTNFWQRRWPNGAAPSLAAPAWSQLRYQGQRLLTGLVQDGLLVTLAANLTALPLVLYHFNRLSLVSLLTNFFIAPVQSLIMLWGSVGLLLGVCGLTWVARPLLWVPWLSLRWTVAVVQWTAALPGASVEVASYGAASLWLTYGGLALFYWRSQLQSMLQRGGAWLRGSGASRLVSGSAAGVLSVGAILLWAGVITQPDGRLHIDFLDIGQGDGILIQTPTGRQVLIDGGRYPQQLLNELGAVMPFWERELDWLVLTHPDADHMDGQSVLPQRFAIGAIWDTAVSQANPDGATWRAAMATTGAPLHLAQSGAWLDLGDGVALWALWPPTHGVATANADNENSLVLKLVYGDFQLLLTGDAGIPSEDALLQQAAPLAATVIKLGHHGSNGSSSERFLKAVQPQLAVIQVGAGNSYGHPHPDVLARLEGVTVLRNDQQGRIQLATDGHHLWVAREKTSHR